MIETTSNLRQFKTENAEGDLFVYVVPTEEQQHPVVNLPSIAFIRNISTGRTYYYSFNHPDSFPEVTKQNFLEEIAIMSNRLWALDKKATIQLLGVPKVKDVNFASYLQNNSIIDASEYDTTSHFLVRSHSVGHGKVGLAVPLMKHLEAFDDLADDVKNIIKKTDADIPFIRFNDLIIETLGDMESQGIYVDRELFKKHFEIDVGEKSMTYSQYNVYTSTGRPSNRFGGVNYAALNQSDGSRSCFCSRYNGDGRIVVIDYTAFHPRIICALTNYPISLEIDIYEYLAKLYFRKKNIDETDIQNAKRLTFRQLYGGVEDKYSHIKYLANLKSFINEQWNFFKTNGYVLTPIFKRKITSHHIQDPNPNKIFNYILQAVEGEIAIPKIREVQKYLLSKKTKAILYTYDAVLYDFHREDGIETLNKIRYIMSFDGKFPMKTYMGDTYQDMRLVS
jgi:hypothetical protein